MWSTAQGRKISTDLMFMLGLNVAIDQFTLANGVRWYCHALRREDGHVLRSALYFEVEEECVKVGLPINVEYWHK